MERDAINYQRRLKKVAKKLNKLGPTHDRVIRHALTPKARKCCENYLGGMTKTMALSEAGYNPKYTAFFRKPKNLAYIEYQVARLTRKMKVTHERIIEEYAKLGFANIGDFMATTADGDVVFDLSSMTKQESAAIQEYVVEEFTEGRGEDKRPVKKIRIKMSDKRQALDSLARVKGMFNDKLTVSGELTLAERLQQGRKRLAKEKKE